MSKVAIITGSSRGIGRAIALQLANDGFNITINYRNSLSEANKLLNEINDITNSICVKADVGNIKSVERLIDATVDEFGMINVLVNNAGTIIYPSDWKNIDQQSWQETLRVNLIGPNYCIKKSVPYLLKNDRSKIINISSTFGDFGSAPVIAYTAAKAGINNITKSLAKELAPKINVNAIAPGPIMTDMLKQSGDEFISNVIKDTPLKRIGVPSDVAEIVSFLASEKSDFITGQVIAVDGGHSLR